MNQHFPCRHVDLTWRHGVVICIMIITVVRPSFNSAPSLQGTERRDKKYHSESFHTLRSNELCLSIITLKQKKLLIRLLLKHIEHFKYLSYFQDKMNNNSNNNNNSDTPTSLFPVHCNIKPFLKGNVQFIFLCNP